MEGISVKNTVTFNQQAIKELVLAYVQRQYDSSVQMEDLDVHISAPYHYNQFDSSPGDYQISVDVNR